MNGENRGTSFFEFVVLWIGQVFSILGTSMMRFALTIWAWQVTGEVTALALVGFFTYTPTVLVSPFAGALVDRWNRKLVMMFSDLAAGFSTVVVLLLFLSGNLQVWHLYVTGAFAGFFQAFHFPAYSAAITLLVSNENYGRASGMLSMARFGASILAPVLAAFLLLPIGFAGVMTIDLLSLAVAVGVLLFIRIPQPKITEEGSSREGNLLRESIYGFRYIYSRSSLLTLQLVYFFIMLVVQFAIAIMSPMILSRTGNDVNVLGYVQAAFGAGGFLGSILLSVWGGPRRRINGVFFSMTLAMLGLLFMGLGRSSIVWIASAFFTMLFVPILDGSDQAIWQSKVPPDVQGRVFGSRLLISDISIPLSMLLAGPLADFIFEPAMMPDGFLSQIFGWLVGVGPGAGMSLIFVFVGVAGVIVCLTGYALPVVRHIEDILPDHKAEVADSKNE